MLGKEVSPVAHSLSSLSTTFLSLVKRASTDLDVEKIRADVADFSLRHPELSPRGKADRIVALTARKAALVGAAASIPPGWGALLATAPELTTLVVLQSRMIVGIHLLFGAELEPEERAGEILAGLAAGIGMSVGRRLTMSAAEAIAARLATRLAGRQAAHALPVVGILAGGLLNYALVRAVGRAVLARVEQRYGPPGLGGEGPVLEAGGHVR